MTNCTFRILVQLNRILTLKHFFLFFFEGFPTVASYHWYGSRQNNKKAWQTIYGF